MERGLHMSSTPIYESHLSINLRCVAIIGQTVRNLRVMILNSGTRLSMRMWLCCRPEIFGTDQLLVVYQGIREPRNYNHTLAMTPREARCRRLSHQSSVRSRETTLLSISQALLSGVKHLNYCHYGHRSRNCQ